MIRFVQESRCGSVPDMVDSLETEREDEQPSEAEFEPDAGPPPAIAPPWYRWTFSVPMAVLLALFVYMAYISFQTTGQQRLVHVIGAVATGLLALLILALQWWDRYPYRVDHPGALHHHFDGRHDGSSDRPARRDPSPYPRLHNGHSHG